MTKKNGKYVPFDREAAYNRQRQKVVQRALRTFSGGLAAPQ
ncbi:hypothetical protein [Paraburkholderia metrosideri]|jgi:hypothetical protein|nr:hypothetical protein [Paraburkholderia metrosideri]